MNDWGTERETEGERRRGFMDLGGCVCPSVGRFSLPYVGRKVEIS